METGGKAHALEELKGNGFTIPDFFICDSTWSEKAILAKVNQQLPTVSFFAVRSSAKGEDSTEKSFAGQFYSAVGIPKENIFKEVQRVVASFKGMLGSVIIQEFIPSETAGVLFTEVNKSSVVINATIGLCRPVVNGGKCDEYICDKNGRVLTKNIQKKTIEVFSDGKITTGENDTESLESTEIKRLIELAAEIQRFFGSPQDVEWCFKGGELYVLQARPITRDFSVAKEEYFDSANIAESYSGIVLPLTCSFAKMVYEQVYKDFLHMSGVSKEKIEQHSDIFENLLGFFYGRMYYNMNNWYRMAEFVPGYQRNKENFELMITSNVKADVGTQIKPSLMLRIFYPIIVSTKVALFGITSELFIFRVKRHLRFLRNHDFEHLTYDECIALFKNLNEQLLRRWYITLENDFLVMTYLGLLKKMLDEKDLQQALVFPSKATEQVVALASLSKTMSEHEALSKAIESGTLEAFQRELVRHPEINLALTEYLHSFGGRFANELKLESIGVDEDPKKLLTVLLAYRQYQPKVTITQFNLPLPFFKKMAVRIILSKFKKYASRREEFRLLRSNTFGMARRLFRRMGKILVEKRAIQEADDIFFLHLKEILDSAAQENKKLMQSIAKRKQEYSSFTDVVPPTHFATVNSQPPQARGTSKIHSRLIQARPASPGVVKGRVKVFKDFSMPQKIDFDILVTSHTDPGWTSLIALSKGLIIEHGGVLSHASIVARELGIPAVIGATDAVSVLHDNEIVEVDGERGIITVQDYAN